MVLHSTHLNYCGICQYLPSTLRMPVKPLKPRWPPQVVVHVQYNTSNTSLDLILVGASSTVHVHSDNLPPRLVSKGEGLLSLFCFIVIIFFFVVFFLIRHSPACDCSCCRTSIAITSRHGRNPIAFVPDFYTRQPLSSELLNPSS